MRAALVSPLLALLATQASAGPLAPTRASQVVVLHPTAVTDSACGSTAYPVDNMRTSTGDVVPFAIPPRQVFVVTSADVFGSATTPSRNYSFSLSIENSAPLAGGSILIGAAPSDAAGYYAGSVSVPSGVVVPPGALLCAKIEGPNDEPTFIRVHGFFAKDK
jgi:hypothetical protein